LAAAEGLRAARVRYAASFLRFRLTAKTDGIAHQQAILDTDDELTVIQARYDLARQGVFDVTAESTRSTAHADGTD
jgi:hypothetical protein